MGERAKEIAFAVVVILFVLVLAVLLLILFRALGVM